jgi:molybdenum cofactor cytidylyltransferase
MGQPKLSLELAPGKCLGEMGLSSLLQSGACSSITAVVREEDSLSWLGSVLERDDVRIAPCPEAEEGMSFSIRTGLKDALLSSPDAVMITLADQPYVSVGLLRGLAVVYAGNRSQVDYVACSYGSNMAPPAIFGRSMFEALADLEGDAGARGLLTDPSYQGVCVEVHDELQALDVDTPQDWQHVAEVYQRLY